MRIIEPPRKNRRNSQRAQSAVTSAKESNPLQQISMPFGEGVEASKGDKRSTQKRTNTAQSDFSRLFAAAVRLLAMREHSRSELETKLSKKTESKDLLFAVLDELRKENYQSDSRFAESFVRSRANRGMGPIKIRSELKNRGVDSAIIDEYLDASAGKWFDRTAAVYQRKYGDSPILQYSDWSKRARFLQSRGFTSEQINDALPARN